MENEKVSSTRVKELAKGAPTEGNCEIRLLNPKRSGTITLRGYQDTDGQYRPFVDQHGQHRVLKITRTIYLNMKNLSDQLLYMAAKLHPIYMSGPRQVLKLVDFESDAKDFVVLKDLEAQANDIIRKLSGENLKDFARILLVMVKPGSSDTVIKRALYEKSVEQPEVIINEWNDTARELKAIVRKGLEKGVFTEKGGRITYQPENGQPIMMGTSFELAVHWLSENDDLVPSLRKVLNITAITEDKE